MSLGRILSFIIMLLFGGLLQLWVVMIILLNVKGIELTIGMLLKDGGLFFFSTSLAYNSFFVLVDKYDLKLGSAHFNISVSLVGLITIIAVVVYSLAQNNILSLGTPALSENNYVYSQISCTVASFTYAFYVASETGLLIKKF